MEEFIEMGGEIWDYCSRIERKGGMVMGWQCEVGIRLVFEQYYFDWFVKLML